MVNDETSESFGATISFGVLSLVVALIGIAVAVLQLRRMSRRVQTAQVFELACKNKLFRVPKHKADWCLGKALQEAKSQMDSQTGVPGRINLASVNRQ